MPTAAIAAYSTQLRMGNGIPLAQLGIASTTNTTPIILDHRAPWPGRWRRLAGLMSLG